MTRSRILLHVVVKKLRSYLNKFHDHGELYVQYILRRCVKFDKSEPVIDDSSMQIVDDKSYLLKCSQLIQFTLRVVDKALISEEATKIYTDGLSNISKQINKLVGSGTSRRNSKSNPIGGVATSAHASGNYENGYN